MALQEQVFSRNWCYFLRHLSYLFDHNCPILMIPVFLTDQLFVNAPFVKIVMITEPANKFDQNVSKIVNNLIINMMYI